MTACSKLSNATEPTAILPGTQLGISLLIRMPTAEQQASSYPDDEPILPEISIGVLDLSIPTEEERDSDDKWNLTEDKAFDKGGREVQHLEYR